MDKKIIFFIDQKQSIMNRFNTLYFLAKTPFYNYQEI